MAEAAGVSEWLLAKKFRQKMGHSINTLIKRIRIELIKNMIETDTPIAKIAELTSFSDVHHIPRFFRRETGLSPTEYKRSL
ncbi:MAG: helix-turn-helix transcriptional regulator [Sedimentisphaerales bacterium]|nr:helix-turn-helix transcriptional regulator [Sedimentisphaerales bacterium]